MPLLLNVVGRSRLLLDDISPLGRRTADGQQVVLDVPDCPLRDNFSLALPRRWEQLREWQYRNDVEHIVAHNISINLNASRMVESVKDVRKRVRCVSWTASKTLATVVLLVRFALNVTSVVTNCVQLSDTNNDDHYSTVRRLVFVLELFVVAALTAGSVFCFSTGLLERRKEADSGFASVKSVAGITSPPLSVYTPEQYRLKRVQAHLYLAAAELLQRAAAFSVLMYLPSMQTVTSFLKNRRRASLKVKEYWVSFHDALRGRQLPRSTIVVLILLTSPVWLLVVGGIAVFYLGLYLLAPFAFVMKLRFQIPFVVTDSYGSWTFLQWVLLAAFISSATSAVNVETIRQHLVFEYVTSGADAYYTLDEFEANEELELVVFMELMTRFSLFKACMLWLSMSSLDLQRVTKKDGPAAPPRDRVVPLGGISPMSSIDEHTPSDDMSRLRRAGPYRVGPV